MKFHKNWFLFVNLTSSLSRSLNTDFTRKKREAAKIADGTNRLLTANARVRDQGSRNTTGRDLGSAMSG